MGIGSLGTTVYTVGANGNFSTLDSALAYFASLTDSQLFTPVASLTGTVTTTQNSDTVTGSGTNFSALKYSDFVDIEGDGLAFPVVSGTVRYPLWSVESDTVLRLTAGYIGTSGAGKAWNAVRPKHYTIILPAGTHSITTDVALPSGLCLDIVGISKMAVTVVLIGIVSSPRTCKLGLYNCSINQAGGVLWNPIDSIDIGVMGLGLGVFDAADIHIMGVGAGGSAVFSPRGSVSRLFNISGTMYRALTTHTADHIVMSNIQIEAGSGAADIVTNQYGGANNATKPWILNNVYLNRPVANTSGSGSILEFNQGLFANSAALQEVYINNLVITDRLQGNTLPGAMQILVTPSTFYINNAIIDNVGSGHGLQLGVNPTTVYAKGVRKLDGSTINVTSGGANATYYDLDNRGREVTTYSASITPGPRASSFSIVATNTTAFTINSVSGAVSGKRYSFDIKNSSGGALGTITWNGAYLLAGAFTSPANTKRRTITFDYDGTNFVECCRAIADI